MIVYNVYNNSEPKLGDFSDSRGTITDIFYGKTINHGCIITNAPGAIRGNHYHNHTTQYTYVLSGGLTYYSRQLSSNIVEIHKAVPGDIIISEPLEIHAMKTDDCGCSFIAFAEGPRGGEDYETDVVRVDSIIL